MSEQPDCKSCRNYWGGGIQKDGKRHDWCCEYDQPAHKIVNNCAILGGYKSESKVKS